MNYTIKGLIYVPTGGLVLVKSHSSMKWSLPGGRKEGKESDEECLKRELWEELRIIKIIDLDFIESYKDRVSFFSVKCRLPNPLIGYEEIREVGIFDNPRKCNLTSLTEYIVSKQ